MRSFGVQLLIGLAFVLTASTVAAEEGNIVGVEAKLWAPEVGADFRSSTDALSGTSIDIDDDLDLDTTKEIPYVKLWLGGRHRLAASATRIKVDGDTRLDEQIIFNGETYNVGEDVSIELKADIYRLAWEADWISTDRLRIGTILGAEYFDVYASIESDTTGAEEEEEVKGPVPIVGLLAEVQLIWGLSVYGEVAGIYAKHGDFEGSLIEAEAGLKFDILSHAHLSAGWRQMNIKVEDEDNKFDLSLGGFIVGAGVRF
ncbi:MAG TPA: hypothetical protein PK280_18845 [Planctomycetota bacterium]|nr:hypothetical protein [Planctomycetota bacterium]